MQFVNKLKLNYEAYNGYNDDGDIVTEDISVKASTAIHTFKRSGNSVLHDYNQQVERLNDAFNEMRDECNVHDSIRCWLSPVEVVQTPKEITRYNITAYNYDDIRVDINVLDKSGKIVSKFNVKPCVWGYGNDIDAEEKSKWELDVINIASKDMEGVGCDMRGANYVITYLN